MCGIAGYFGEHLSADAGRALLQRMCDPIVHRGPDDEGYALFRQCGLGVRRLSIIDLAGGHQPVTTDDGLVQIVFNGEIYNYRDLRTRLAADGHLFRTASDTEVILRQYESVGRDCVQALNGMFAFAIWDGRRRELMLARDRLGVKPLYYWWDGRSLFFASEQKCILAAGVSRQLDSEALWDYLTFRYVPAPRTIWQGIRKLPPGHTLTIAEGQTEPLIHRYWRCPAQEGFRRSDEDYLAEFGELFTDSVRLRLVADVPVGVLLSGGLDSSAVLAAATQLYSGRMKTFAVGYAGSFSSDERRWARQMAAAVGAEHTEVEMGDQEFLDFLPRLAHLTDEPLADLASVPLHFVASLAASQVKVVLSGEGGDEVLAGYDLDRAVRRWNLLARLGHLPFRRSIQRLVPAASRLGGLLADLDAPEDAWFEHNPPTMVNLMSSAEKRAILQPDFRAGARDSLDLVREHYRKAAPASRLGRLLESYRQDWLVEDLLMKADRMTMANSIELRAPFLDYRLVEWAARAPDAVKVRRTTRGHWETKWVLRELGRGMLPSSIVGRPKQGFPLPADERITTSMREWVTDTLTEPLICRWLRPDGVRRLVEEGTRRFAPFAKRRQLWAVLMLELWAREWRPD